MSNGILSAMTIDSSPTNARPARYRKLRIAWSVVWGVAVVLLCMLWLRSQNHFDDIGGAMSAQGKLYISPKVSLFPTDVKGAAAESYGHFGGRVTTLKVRNMELVPLASTGPVLPYWPLALVTSLIAPMPWIRWRFSLRTLLIATTLVAVVLGAVIYATRD